MPAFHVARSTVIDAQPDHVFDTVADYGTWTTWSPWLGVDKNAQVTVSDDPRSIRSQYSWTGDLVGDGEIEHKTLNRPRRIDDELRFLRPMKTTSQVAFDIEPAGNGTKVTWHMKGKLPWFLFWMTSSMDTFVGMDYERGLKMLKEYIETGEVLSDIEITGIERFGPMTVLGQRESCRIDEIGPTMARTMETVRSKLSDHNIEPQNIGISIYHTADLKARQFDFTSGFAVPSDAAVPTGLIRCDIPSADSLHVCHTGSYDNLGNAWSGAHQYVRYKKIKLAKGDAYEVCRNDPQQTATKDLLTDLYLPIK